MKRALVLGALLVSAAAVVQAQDVAGNWQGTLHTGTGELRVVLHVTKGDGGNLKATLDSIDQGANGIPVDSILLKESKLTFTVEAVHGSFEGSVQTDAIEGTWTQGQPLPLVFKRMTTPLKTEHKPAKPSDIDGTWSGTIDSGARKLRVVFHLVNTEDGLMGTMDVPDQNVKGLPITTVTRQGSSLMIEMRQIGGKYDGKIAPDLSGMNGTWSQGGISAPLLLSPDKPGQAESPSKL